MSFSYTEHERIEALERKVRELEAQVQLLMELVREKTIPPPHPIEGDLYNLNLIAYPSHHKISVIKVIREVTGLGLKEAKDLSESLPARIKSRVDAQEANRIAQAFANIGIQIDREMC